MLESLCGPSSLQFYEKETPTLMFSCEYCEIFKSNYFKEHCERLLLILRKRIDTAED